jgi:hypothetical protein
MSVFRDEIASCMEKAYLDISCAHAAKMLSLKEGESDLRIKYLLWTVPHLNPFPYFCSTTR